MKSNTKDPWSNKQMSVEIAGGQDNLVTVFHLLKLLQVVFGIGLQAFVCEYSRQNICSACYLTLGHFINIFRELKNEMSPATF